MEIMHALVELTMRTTGKWMRCHTSTIACLWTYTIEETGRGICHTRKTPHHTLVPQGNVR